jgi:hypothetical protein
MNDYIKIDSSIGESDWAKKGTWDFPGINTLKDFVGETGVSEDQDNKIKKQLLGLLKLPSAYPMPDDLRKEIYLFIGESPVNPKFIDKISWCIDAVFDFFPEEVERITTLSEKIKKDGIRFYSDLDFEDQMFILDLETRDIPQEDYPLSQFKQDLKKSAKIKTDTIE